MVEEYRKHPKILAELDPIFQVADFEEGAIKPKPWFMAKDQPTTFGTDYAIGRSTKGKFDQEGIRLSCPTRFIVSSGAKSTSAPVRSSPSKT